MLTLSPHAIRSRIATVVAVLIAGTAPSLQAQVGHMPGESPYRDVHFGQTVSASAGWLAMKRDPAGVSPDAGAFGQLRYDVAIGGPAIMFARYSLAPSQRNLLLPAVPVEQRILRTPGTVMHIIEGGLDIALTGKKSWHGLVPTIGGGAGIVSDFAAADTGSYQFGVKFSLSYGLGVRYMLSNGMQMRLEANNFLWQYDYPDRYFVAASDGSAILVDSDKRSAWRGNWGLSAGLALPIFR
jgi:hypothetical protein